MRILIQFIALTGLFTYALANDSISSVQDKKSSVASVSFALLELPNSTGIHLSKYETTLKFEKQAFGNHQFGLSLGYKYYYYENQYSEDSAIVVDYYGPTVGLNYKWFMNRIVSENWWLGARMGYLFAFVEEDFKGWANHAYDEDDDHGTTGMMVVIPEIGYKLDYRSIQIALSVQLDYTIAFGIEKQHPEIIPAIELGLGYRY